MARLHAIIAKGAWVTSFSAGVAVYEEVPPTAEAALKGADRLMYDVKHGGKRGYKLEVVCSGAPCRAAGASGGELGLESVEQESVQSEGSAL